jgi:hypothetical protein
MKSVRPDTDVWVSDYQIASPSLLASFLWTVILAAAVVAGSFALSCTMPFAALAVALAATVGLRASLATIALVWGVNQIVGFTWFHFPWTATAFGQGAAIGVAALLGALVAHVVLSHRGLGRLGLALLLSFAVYEATLWLAALGLGGRETFAMSIVMQIALINAAWFAGLSALNEIAAALCKPWLGRIPMVRRSSGSS